MGAVADNDTDIVDIVGSADKPSGRKYIIVEVLDTVVVSVNKGPFGPCGGAALAHYHTAIVNAPAIVILPDPTQNFPANTVSPAHDIFIVTAT